MKKETGSVSGKNCSLENVIVMFVIMASVAFDSITEGFLFGVNYRRFRCLAEIRF